VNIQFPLLTPATAGGGAIEAILRPASRCIQHEKWAGAGETTWIGEG